jgi:glutamyl-tRNA synthetase
MDKPHTSRAPSETSVSAPREPYVGRFAPSPTGNMHVGVARTMLAAWLDARKNRGRILLRIEDIDRPRVVAGASERIMRDLEWLGLTWDEGPVFQSDRDPIYLAALDRLAAIGRIYPCTCSRKEIALASSAPHGPSDEGPRYPGTCRDGAVERPGRTPSVRLRTNPGDHIQHTDLTFGLLEEEVHETTGDFVIKRSDGLWAYQLAVTADDLAQGVTRIVRGADLLSSTPRQILLRRLLDPRAPQIETLHVPLFLGPDKKRLAKRDGASGVASRRESGEPPEALIGMLAASFRIVPFGTRALAEELISLWDPGKISLEDQIHHEDV